MPSFDIQSFLNFRPPTYSCLKCRALGEPDTHYNAAEKFGKKTITICRVCGTEYLPTEKYRRFHLDKWLKSRYETFNPYDEIIDHAHNLAWVARRLRSIINKDSSGSVVEALFESISAARHFIHFSTFGISLTFVGALKLAAQRVKIRGIVTNPSSFCLAELAEFPEEAPNFKAHIFGTGNGMQDVPHQKLIVIDGLLAFKGSVNLTVDGWRKVAKNLDLLEVVTDIEEIKALHNTLFSPVWGKVNQDVAAPIEMTDQSPF